MVYEFGPRIFHVHAKDLRIDRTQFISALYGASYDSSHMSKVGGGAAAQA